MPKLHIKIANNYSYSIRAVYTENNLNIVMN